MEKKVVLKFLHVTAQVRIIGDEFHYRAVIKFPYAYMEPSFNNFTIDDIFTSSMDKAWEIAYTIFTDKYRFLDKAPRQIHRFNFFLHRARFQKLTHRVINGERFTFLAEDQVYAISENVDGKKYFKSKFQRRSEIAVKEALLFINYPDIFKPMNDAGFNFKLIDRILERYNHTSLAQLRLYNDPIVYLINPSQLVYNYIRLPGKADRLHGLIYYHRIMADLKKPNIP